MARLFPVNQFLDDSGDPLNGGKLYTYETGTSTDKATYQEQAASTAHANPIILDAAGRPPADAIWLLTDGEYRFVLKDSTDATTFFTIDDISGMVSPLSGAEETHNLQFQDGRGLLDDSGNEVLIIKKNTSAVNYVEVSNAATGSGPSVDAKGDDTNIPMTVSSKGTGDVILSSGGDITLTATSTVTANTNRLDNSIMIKHIYGLTMSNDTDTDHDIALTTGSCADSTDAVMMTVTAALVKRIDANWAAGTGNGGFPSGLTLTADTWYHYFIIKHTDGTVDAGFDSSSTASNLLSDSSYTYYRRIGSILTDSSSNITQFIQYGDTFYWDNPPLDVDTSTGTIGNNYTLSVPPDVRVMANINMYTENASAYTGMYLRPSDADDEAPSETAAPLATVQNSVANEGQFVNTQILTNTSKQIYARAEANSTTIRVATIGWRDFRGTN